MICSRDGGFNWIIPHFTAVVPEGCTPFSVPVKAADVVVTLADGTPVTGFTFDEASQTVSIPRDLLSCGTTFHIEVSATCATTASVMKLVTVNEAAVVDRTSCPPMATITNGVSSSLPAYELCRNVALTRGAPTYDDATCTASVEYTGSNAVCGVETPFSINLTARLT